MHLFTIGHSTHTGERFLELLQEHQIEALIDIRRFPASRRWPQFNRENLEPALQQSGIEYDWLEALGGRRSRRKGFTSPNAGLRNDSFRNYADYMLTDEFRQGIAKLRDIAERRRSAIMCSENLFWRCHRRLVSDYLIAAGDTVEHIFPGGELRPHQLTAGAVFAAGEVTYPGEPTLFQ